jgi:Fe-S-cluster-containing dehydrogenase component/anaerobic selenocysteine-containing dehydrogenase
MAGLNRRDFLKALGLGSTASAAAGCGFDQNYYRQPIEQILPYLVRPEQVIPGTPTFFATTVTTGPNAHPVLARHRDGRVVNVGANPRAAAKGIPRAALLELQRHYSPDRPKAPRVDAAESGWDEALQQVAGAVKAAKDGGRKIAYIGPHRSGSIVSLLREFTGGNAVFWEPAGREAEALAAEKLFGQRVLPAYDLSKAHYVLSFGADFLGTWGGPSLESQYARARNPNEGNFVARFAHVSPHRGQTGANADDWYPAHPGSEAQVALAVAKLVAERVGYSGPLAGLVGQANVEGAATAAGLKKEDLEAIAAEFAAGAAVALPGGAAGASAAATDLAIATYALNLVSGNGGITFGFGPVYAGPIDAVGAVEALIADAANIAVLFVDDVNPVYALPGSGFAEALGKVGMSVSVNPFNDETSAACKVHLPCADMLEDWGDEEPAAGFHLLRQPTMSPLNDSRSFGDVLLATARAAGMGEAAPAAAAPAPAAKGAPAPAPAPTTLGFAATNWREYIKARWQRDVFGSAGASGSFESFWSGALENGFVDLGTKLVPPSVAAAEITIGAAPANGELTLIVYPHAFRQDGRYANEPWAQEVPDPMTGVVWDSWLEIHPTTADGLGVAEGDLVEVSTEAGKVEVAAKRYLGVAPGTIALAMGQGHGEAKGRYAEAIGVNAASLIKVAKDASGAMIWQSKASVAKAAGEAFLVSTFGSDVENDRDFGVVVPAAELAKVGDAPAEHAGELTGIHHLELDQRLQKAGITDFYGMPDHPTYRFGMTVDVNACNGCGVCAIACYAENNLPVVGKQKVYEGREMGWLRIDRFWSEDDGDGPNEIRFVPMMCQHCGHAPCESVCPVLATYHTIDGLNAMIYNRCVGTRYCSNNCPYKVRRFNWHSYVWPEPFNLQLNPDVSSRTMGVMEKCTFCVQRIRAVKSAYKNTDGFTAVVPDAALKNLPACVEACPSSALTFGNLNDPESTPSKTRKSARNYEVLAELNVFPAINYLGKASFHYVDRHGGGHADAAGHGAEGEHGAAPAHGEGEAHPPAEAPAEHH